MARGLLCKTLQRSATPVSDLVTRSLLSSSVGRLDMRTHALLLERPPAPAAPEEQLKARPLKVAIAGAGIGGLVLALALLKQGVQVEVFERDLTAVRGEGKYRGPIQVSVPWTTQHFTACGKGSYPH